MRPFTRSACQGAQAALVSLRSESRCPARVYHLLANRRLRSVRAFRLLLAVDRGVELVGARVGFVGMDGSGLLGSGLRLSSIGDGCELLLGSDVAVLVGCDDGARIRACPAHVDRALDRVPALAVEDLSSRFRHLQLHRGQSRSGRYLKLPATRPLYEVLTCAASDHGPSAMSDPLLM